MRDATSNGKVCNLPRWRALLSRVEVAAAEEESLFSLLFLTFDISNNRLHHYKDLLRFIYITKYFKKLKFNFY